MFKKVIVILMVVVFSVGAIQESALGAPANDKTAGSVTKPSKSPHIQPSAPPPPPLSNPTPTPTLPTAPSPPLPALQKPPFTKFAITFDDGPDPLYTPQILALLDKFGAQSTFFMVGMNVTQYPVILQQVAVSGNEIAAHTMTHPYPPDWSDSALDYEITASVSLLRQTSGKPIHYFRPPYGEDSTIYTQRAPILDVKIIKWTVDPKDWSGISAELIAERVLDKLQPGCILLMHDGGGKRQETVNALEIILREAKARGYNSVSLSELDQ